MKQSKHVVTWFVIPTLELERAVRFYSTVLGVTLQSFEMGPNKMARFPGGSKDEDVVHGALVQGEGYMPGESGPLVYLNGGEDLAAPLSRVEALGGKILKPKTSIGEHGFMAIFRDTEGNRVAIHSWR